jgi:hypothetical protein
MANHSTTDCDIVKLGKVLKIDSLMKGFSCKMNILVAKPAPYFIESKYLPAYKAPLLWRG